MEQSKILAKVDHTLLSTTATWAQIMETCQDALTYETASVCIPPRFVRQAKELLADKIAICTVIGFPNGYNTGIVKALEAEDAVHNGAEEIDMVIANSMVKEKQYDAILLEIDRVKAACSGKLLKVIVETCYLTEIEKIALCQVVSASQADFIKTSTGFGTNGATPEDIRLFAKYMTNGKQIKAAGGIRSFADAEVFLEAGADRLGTSALVKIMKEKAR